MKNFFIKIWNALRSVSPITYVFAAFMFWLFIIAPLDTYEYTLMNSRVPLVETPLVAQIIAYITMLTFIAALSVAYFFAFPLIRLVLVRIGVYFRLLIVCARLKFRLRLGRFPLASLFGVRSKADVRIECGRDVFCIHFVDVVGRARVFSLVSDKEYDVAKTLPDAPGRPGAPRYGMAVGRRPAVIMGSTIYKGKTKCFPPFDEKEGKHIIILDPLPMEVRYIGDNVARILYSGYVTGKITYYEAKDFIKYLERI